MPTSDMNRAIVVDDEDNDVDRLFSATLLFVFSSTPTKAFTFLWLDKINHRPSCVTQSINPTKRWPAAARGGPALTRLSSRLDALACCFQYGRLSRVEVASVCRTKSSELHCVTCG